MKKLIALGLFALIMMTQSTTASAQRVEFRGVVFFTSVTQPCIDEGGYNVRDYMASRFTPGGVGDNTFTGFSYFFIHFAESYRTTDNYTQLTKGNFVEVAATGVGRGAFDFGARMRFTSVKPAAIKANTNTLRLVGEIQDLDGIAGCNAKFRAAYNRRQ